MAKKKFGKFVALATVTGVVAAGISYFLRYKSFHNELNDDFHEFEDDDFDGELPHENEVAERTYVSLGDKKPEDEQPVSRNSVLAEENEKTVTPEAAEPSAVPESEATVSSDTATTIVEDDTLDL
ncbi:MAG: hypothetical protein ACLT46_14615 [Hungatella sp.]